MWWENVKWAGIHRHAKEVDCSERGIVIYLYRGK